MRAIKVDEHGGPEVLKLVETPSPEPGEHDVIIDVAFCGCNWADIMIRSGTYPNPMPFPLIMGVEVSGVVNKVGSKATRVAPGDRVCSIVETAGGYAEQVRSREQDVMTIPDELSLEAAAAFPIQALTAYHMLHTLYQIKPGDNVLCHAIAGGVGLYVTQMVKRAGANIIGTTGTKGKEAKALEFGADWVVNYREEDFVEAALDFTKGEGIDLAIDSIGAATLDKTYDAMKKLGMVISIGEAAGEPYKNIRERIMTKSLAFIRFHLQHVGPATPLWKKGQDYVMQGLVDGWLRAPVEEIFPLEKVSEMHRRIESRQVAGKLLLACN